MEARPTRRTRKTLVVTIVLHSVLAGIIAAVGVTLSLEALGVLAAVTIVFVMLVVSLVYFRSFGREPVGKMREGPVGLSRGYMLFESWAVL